MRYVRIDRNHTLHILRGLEQIESPKGYRNTLVATTKCGLVSDDFWWADRPEYGDDKYCKKCIPLRSNDEV